MTRERAVDDEQRQQQLDERWKRGMTSCDMHMIGGAAADVDVQVDPTAHVGFSMFERGAAGD